MSTDTVVVLAGVFFHQIVILVYGKRESVWASCWPTSDLKSPVPWASVSRLSCWGVL